MQDDLDELTRDFSNKSLNDSEGKAVAPAIATATSRPKPFYLALVKRK